MTYGQIRALLRQRDSAMPMERLDMAIQNGLETILGRQPWPAMRGEIIVSTVAKYDTGTVEVTNGSTSITGTGTSWTAAMSGRKIRVGNDTGWYLFTWVSATEGELDRAYEGETASGASYRLFQDLVTLGADVAAVTAVNYPRLRPLRLATISQLNAGDPARQTYGDPCFFAEHYRTDPASPPSVAVIELWPSPDQAQALQIEYRRVLTGFDGTNTGDSPPAWVSPGAIHALAEFELFADEAAFARADRLIEGMIQNKIEGQAGGVRIPRDRSLRPSATSAWPRNPGAEAWARSD